MDEDESVELANLDSLRIPVSVASNHRGSDCPHAWRCQVLSIVEQPQSCLIYEWMHASVIATRAALRSDASHQSVAFRVIPVWHPLNIRLGPWEDETYKRSSVYDRERPISHPATQPTTDHLLK